MIFRSAFCIVSLSILAALGGCDSGETTRVDSSKRLNDTELQQLRTGGSTGERYLFGFDLRSSPREDARQYLPFLQFLERATGMKLELSFTPAGENIVDRLGRGKVQFAAIGAVSYIEAREKYKAVILARGVNAKGEAEYRSKLVVRRDSALKLVIDLKGRKLAFGSKSSTQGHLIPRIVLESKGLRLADFSMHEYTGSHLNCANAVISGRADVCGMQDTMADEMEARGLLKILHISPYFPSSGIAASPSLPGDKIVIMQRALLEFQPKGRNKGELYNWDKTEMPNGFVIAQNADYETMRKWMIKLGMLASRTTGRR